MGAGNVTNEARLLSLSSPVNASGGGMEQQYETNAQAGAAGQTETVADPFALIAIAPSKLACTCPFLGEWRPQ